MSVFGSVPTTFGVELAVVLEDDLNLGGLTDHVVVGHGIAVSAR